MTGFGRTGEHFAIEHFGIEPDIITFGKGVSSGYAPLGGMIVHDQLIEALIANSNGKFTHGYTYSGHPVSVAAGLAAVKYYKEKNILANCKQQSKYLFKQLGVFKRKASDYRRDKRKRTSCGIRAIYSIGIREDNFQLDLLLQKG